MDRRRFLRSLASAGAAGLLPAGQGCGTSLTAPVGDPAFAETAAAGRTPPAASDAGPKTWLFWDLWRLDRAENLDLRQGRPQWRPEATYVDDVDGLAAWPTVYRVGETSRWRMLYTSRWRPWSLMVAESEDGIRFRPLACSDVVPEGDRRAPHHIFTLAGGSAGGVYLDPVAADGFGFKVFAHRQGDVVRRRALADPAHRWHEAAKQAGRKPYLAEELTVVSADGLHWHVRTDLDWGGPHWHPEPPIFGFWNRHAGRHMMTVRPGWGDRRVCLQSTEDFRAWSGPALLLQPDPLDGELVELYGMPVFPYAGWYVGLLWTFHPDPAEPIRGFNRSVGPVDCQLAYSRDGLRFVRGPRQPFIACNAPGEHGCGGIEPSCLVETEKELRLYSSGSKVPHGKNWIARREGMKDFEGVLLHTLRKDGFMYLASRAGGVARFLSRPLAFLSDGLTMNAAAGGEVACQVTNVRGEALPGFAFADFEPFAGQDALAWPLRWRGGGVGQLRGKPVRLEVQFRQARLYAFRGHFHFLDAQDMHLLEDGRPIAPVDL